MSELLSRRKMLKSGGMIAVGLVAPRWLGAVAQADVLRAASGRNPATDTILVVCQFTGGNDGLNTVIPYSDSNYYTLRPTIGIKDADVLKITDSVGFHPSLTGLAELYKQGKVAIIQNVGYPNPNRSHFKSMEIWQSASPDSKLQHGWVGRHFDVELAHHPLNPVVAIGLSTEKPLALDAENASVPCFASLADLQNLVGDADAEKMLREIQGMDASAGSATRAVQQANDSALDAVSILKTQLKNFTPKQTYNHDPFGNGFKQIAQLIATSPATRVVYFSVSGFDTHASQPDIHARLLKEFGDALNSFQKEIETIGKADKVVVLTFSEFGRRAHENASLGTDHGAAAPMFVIGTKVKGGLHGPIPDLAHLEDGDIAHKVDFREVYAATLDQWLGGDSATVLGEKFNYADILA